jgi:chromosome segregation ATPase
MNLDELIKKVSALEDENRTSNKTLAALNAKIKKIEDSNTSFLETTRDIRKEVERLGAIVSRLGQFDSALTQVRVDFAKKISELDMQQKKMESAVEKVRKENQDMANEVTASTKTALTATVDKKMQTFFEEDSRLYKKVLEMQESFENNLNREQSLQKTAAANIEETNRIAKRIEAFQADFEMLKKKVDEETQKVNIIADDLRKNESRLNELAAMENQRKLDQAKFMDQQTLLQSDRDRTWKEWIQQFNEITRKTNVNLQDVSNQSQELKRSKDAFDEITQRFDRRMNELTEMYRILEERLRQDWSVFKADEQKRWSNYSLIFGEKEGDFLNQFEKTKNRLTDLEDHTSEIQEVFLMVSTELQKGMQGLMQMVNNWIQTFDDIRSSSKTEKPGQ